MKHDSDDFDELPDALIDELKSADRGVPLITSRVDREVLRMAREQFAPRRRSLWRRPPTWAAVAAAVVLAVYIVPTNMAPDIAPKPADISDVLKMARARAGEPGAQADIDAFAMRVVSLERTGESS